MSDNNCANCRDLIATLTARAAEVERYKQALRTIALTGTDVAPGMDAETSYRYTANDCIRTAARALRPSGSGDTHPTETNDG